MKNEKRPTAARVSEAVAKLGNEKHYPDKGNSGYRCHQWVLDEYGNPTVKVEWFMGKNPDLGPGRRNEGRIHVARYAKLREILVGLGESGYHVVWGWDPETGDPDTNFIAVISSESAEKDTNGVVPDQPQASVRENDEEPFSQADMDEQWGTDLNEERVKRLMIYPKEAREAVLAINQAYNTGRDEVARRMEHRLMMSVLMTIVCEGPENAVDLAALALDTQHLPFAR